jgi:hypothetical protein
VTYFMVVRRRKGPLFFCGAKCPYCPEPTSCDCPLRAG